MLPAGATVLDEDTIRRAGYFGGRKTTPSMGDGSEKSWRRRRRCVDANNAQGSRRTKRGNGQKRHLHRPDPASRRDERTGAIRAVSIEECNALCRALIALATLNKEDFGCRAVRTEQGVRLKWRTRRQCDRSGRGRLRVPLNATELPATADVCSRLIWQRERRGEQDKKERETPHASIRSAGTPTAESAAALPHRTTQEVLPQAQAE
jgi:hypothetical protein